MVHRIIGETFIDNVLNKATVNHKWGDKSDNRVLSLEWSTHSEQNIHAYKELGRAKTFGLGKKVTQFDLCNKKIETYDSYAAAARATYICKTSIIDCINGRAKTAGNFIWVSN